MIDVFTISDFLPAAAREEILAELGRASGGPAGLLGRDGADLRVRKTSRVTLSPATGERVKRLLLERKEALGDHFGVALSGCEDPQFLRYDPGDFFVPHQDGNTGMVFDDSRFRRVSAVVFLSPQRDEPAPGAYGGGSLVFHGPSSDPGLRLAAPADPGTLVAFRSETTHEVTPVTHGVRYTIVTWFR